MEGKGQNFFASERLNNTDLYPNRGTILCDDEPPNIDFGEVNREGLQGLELVLDDESSNAQGGADTLDEEVSWDEFETDLEQMLVEEEVSWDEFATDLEQMLVEEEVSWDEFATDLEQMLVEEEPRSITESAVSDDQIVGVGRESEWDMSTYDENSTTTDADLYSSRSGFGFQRDQPWLGGENSDQAHDQDISIIEFESDLERMIANDHRPRLLSTEMQTTEMGDTEQVGVPRPVVPPSESIGVTYHRKNKQWEAHLWLKNQQLRNQRKKKGVQLFLGNFATCDEAKQAHDRAAIKLGISETSRGKAYQLNFPESAHADYIAAHADWSARDFVWKLRRDSAKFSKGKSCMKGVSTRKGKKGSALYEAKISRTSREGEKVTFPLGTFASEDAAGMAYDRALLYLKGVEELTCVTNFRPSSYSAEEIEEAGSSLDL